MSGDVSGGATPPAGASFALFETAIGPCAIAWADHRVVGVWLPEPSAAATRARLLRRLPDAAEREPDDEIRAAVSAIASLLAGEPRDLSRVPLDLDRVGPFDRKVYELARTIPPGATRTYGDLATTLGDRMLSREVGQSLARNPFPIVVPCHRVVAAGGKSGGFTAPGGVSTKLRMLEIEGAREPDPPTLWDVQSSVASSRRTDEPRRAQRTALLGELLDHGDAETQRGTEDGPGRLPPR